MKKEPLKGKRVNVKVLKSEEGNLYVKIYREPDGELVEVSEIKSAVEWLKEQLNNFKNQNKDGNEYDKQRASAFDDALQMVDKAFEDVTQSTNKTHKEK